MDKNAKQFNTVVGGRIIELETGKLADQAGGAVTIRLGDSIVFAAATMAPAPAKGTTSSRSPWNTKSACTPAARIPGSFFRREGRPSTDAILTARLTDRPLRPLFAQEMRNEVQVIMFSISADQRQPARHPGHQRRFRRHDDLGHPLGRPGRRCARRTCRLANSSSTPPSPKSKNPTSTCASPAPATPS